MAKFFDTFPLLSYSITSGNAKEFQLVTNIFFRLSIIKEVLNNITAYYEYIITDNDRPEILAEKIYGNPEAHWIILYANDMLDPQYDWPLNSRDFDNYIINKYGSIANSKNTVHHYEKVVTRTENLSGVSTQYRYVIDFEPKANNNIQVPYDYYENLAETQSVETFDIYGKTITEVTFRNIVTVYDHEVEMNEKKRLIKIIKPEYYPRIMSEMRDLTGSQQAFIRGL